jgi:aminomethyltransferase
MFVNRGEDLFLIVNGACKEADIAHIQSRIGQPLRGRPTARARPAGPARPASRCGLSRLIPGVTQLVFMTGNHFDWQGHALYITRSGYTGEDGLKSPCPAKQPKPLPKLCWHSPRWPHRSGRAQLAAP